MSTQHTPGPLFAVRAKQGGDYAVKDRENHIVAECYEDIREPGECASDEAKANAMLYAAAPELLAALDEARDGLRWYQDSFPQATDGSDDEAMTRINAAIAKATGSASS